MLVSCQQMREAEERLFAGGAVDAETLMEKAGLGCAQVIHRRFPRPGLAVLFVGKGNNGGDALVIGRLLRSWGWRVCARYACPETEMTELAADKRREFDAGEAPAVACGPASVADEPSILIDGLLGIGARGPLRGVIAELAEEMNHRRAESDAISFSVDVPSGVDGDSGECYPGAVVADHTLTIAQVKAGLVADAAVGHVGRLDLIPLEEIPMASGVGDEWLITAGEILPWLPRRAHDWHKGDAGRIGILAGSPGLIGAADLVARGALRGGGGLVTVLAHDVEIHNALVVRLPAEVMARRCGDDPAGEIAALNFDALAIGPGIGERPPAWLIDRIVDDPRPAVIDADGLNALAASPESLEALRVSSAPRLLTPHPGEMRRLMAAAGLPDTGDRARAAQEFAEGFGVAVLLKGARTVVAGPGQSAAFNSTGNPGMASGGMGDVLGGLCAALLAVTGDPYRAACLGAWLAGRSADRVVDSGLRSQESLSAVDVAEGLGAAFRDLRSEGGK